MHIRHAVAAAAAGLTLLGATACGPMINKATGGALGHPGEIVIHPIDAAAVAADPRAAAGKYFKTSFTENFKDNATVVIPRFRIGYVTQTKAGAQAMAALDSDRGTATVRVSTQLQGVDDALLQAITDATYARFVAALQAKGWNVVTPDQLVSKSALVAEVAAKKQAMPLDVNGLRIFLPSGHPVYYGSMEQGGLAGTASLFSGSNAEMIHQKLLAEQKASILSVDLTVDFTRYLTDGGMLARSAEVQVKPVLSVAPGSRLTFLAVKDLNRVGIGGITIGPGELVVKAPIESDQSFGPMTEEASTAADVISAAFLNQERGRYVVQADPAQYRAVTTSLLDATTDMMVAELTS